MRKAYVVITSLLLVLAASSALAIEPFFSEYVEGSSFNKALEIFNPGPSPLNLTGYEVRVYFNGAVTPQTLALNAVTVPAAGVYVIAHSSANAAILAAVAATGGQTSSAVVNFNGDDAITLTKNAGATVLDCIGQVGLDPGTMWGTGGITTLDHTLRRRFGPDTVVSDPFDPAIEWSAYAVDTVNGLGFADLTVVSTEADSWGGIKSLYR